MPDPETTGSDCGIGRDKEKAEGGSSKIEQEGDVENSVGSVVREYRS
jgi:hypothetical protein